MEFHMDFTLRVGQTNALIGKVRYFLNNATSGGLGGEIGHLYRRHQACVSAIHQVRTLSLGGPSEGPTGYRSAGQRTPFDNTPEISDLLTLYFSLYPSFSLFFFLKL